MLRDPTLRVMLQSSDKAEMSFYQVRTTFTFTFLPPLHIQVTDSEAAFTQTRVRVQVWVSVYSQ